MTLFLLIAGSALVGYGVGNAFVGLGVFLVALSIGVEIDGSIDKAVQRLKTGK